MRRIAVILGVLILVTKATFGQSPVSLERLKEFYTTDWLFELPDTTYYFLTRDSIPERTRYSVVKKIKANNYDLACWSDQWNMIETPIQIKDKLRIRFVKQGKVVLQFGRKKKATYLLRANQLVLLKE